MAVVWMIVSMIARVVPLQLLEPAEVLQEGKIRDSNRTTLISQLQEHGFPVVDLEIAEDT